MNSNIKKTVYFCIFLVFLFGISVGIGLIIKQSLNDDKDVIKSNDVILIASSDTFTINNKIAVSDEFGVDLNDDNGGMFVYYDFAIANHSNDDRDYEIYITRVDDGEPTFNVDYLKFYLTTGNNFSLNVYDTSKIPSYSKLPYMIDKPSSKLLYSGKLSRYCTSDMILRVWIAENYIPTKDVKKATFEIQVRAI